MNQTELKALIRQEVLAELFRETGTLLIPVNVSNRHVHLDESALVSLFGAGHELTKQKGFPCFRVGKRVLINRDMLQAWLDEQCNRTA